MYQFLVLRIVLKLLCLASSVFFTFRIERGVDIFWGCLSKGRAIELHRLWELLNCWEVLFRFFFDDFVEVFVFGVGKIAIVGLFSTWYPRWWICDECFPVYVCQKWMFLKFGDASNSSKSLFRIFYKKFLQEVFSFRVHIAIFFTVFRIFHFFVQNVLEDKIRTISIKRQISCHKFIA